jgi:two-component system, chemotaxis family, sensor kinase CheA
LTNDLSMDPEQQDILLGFVDEGREMLDEVEPLLIEIEQLSDSSGEIDLEAINTVFRLFHSLKGGAGFLDLSTINGVTHIAETLLDKFRKNEGTLKSEHIDILTTTCDFLRKLLDQIETVFNDSGHEEEAEDIKNLLTITIDTLNGVDTVSPEPIIFEEMDSGDKASKAGIIDDTITLSENASDDAPPPLDALQLTISPEMIKQFTTEAEEQLEQAEAALLDLEKNPDDSEQIQIAFRSFHSFKGNSGFLGYKDMEKLSHSAESVLDEFREETLKPNSKVINLILEIIDFLRGAVSTLSEGGLPNIPATPGLISLLKDYSGATTEPLPAKQEPIAPIEVENDQIIEIEIPDIEIPDVIEKEVIKETKPSQTKTLPKSSTPKAKKDIPQPNKSNAQRQSVRVDVEKLDVLLDLVGELVISEAMVSQNPDLKEIDVSLDRFDKATMQLNKITRDLQDIANSIRMIPLAGTFRRMVRLVRDLSQKAGKKVDLVIIGEETEVDKTVIEQITDPLIHIIRNSIDHGLETPDKRSEIGKNPSGKLTIEAKYVGGEVWICIQDDGYGLNREKILERAISRDLFQGDTDELTDSQVWQFIFNPGFSTAEKVTDISGRGVGMDVVRRNIENIRGKVDVSSTEGVGTQVILRIPLTLAIIDGMLTRVGEEIYTIPITAIRESIQVTEDMVTRTMDGQEIVRVREHLIPVVRLHELLGVKMDTPSLEDGILTIIESDKQSICLFLDEVLEQQQIVIKGMSEYIEKHSCISGCTILGDGDISLILDVAGIINNAQGAVQAEL